MRLIERSIKKLWYPIGYLSINSLANISRGQRQLLIGDIGTGKTSISYFCSNSIYMGRYSYLKSLVSFISVFCLIGSSRREFRFLKTSNRSLNLNFSFVSDLTFSKSLYNQVFDPMRIVENFIGLTYKGLSSVIVLDSLDNHSKSYRNVMLDLKRAPGREAFPSDIFYIHSSILEKFGNLDLCSGNASCTAFPIIGTFDSDFSKYIPTNLISITDGQWVFSNYWKSLGLFPSLNLNATLSRLGSLSQSFLLKSLLKTFKNLLFKMNSMEFSLISGLSKDFVKLPKNLYKSVRGSLFLNKNLCYFSMIFVLLLFKNNNNYVYCNDFSISRILLEFYWRFPNYMLSFIGWCVKSAGFNYINLLYFFIFKYGN